MKTESRAVGDASLFIAEKNRESRVFCALMKRTSTSSALVAEHETELIGASRASARALKEFRILPLCRDGTPYVYRLAQKFLDEQGGVFQEKDLKETLFASGKDYYDEELKLLPSFLILAATERYLRGEEAEALHSILRVLRTDFSSVFFSFSKVEKIFLSEAAGIYANGTAETKHLYHARLSEYAKENGRDPILAARHIVAKANEKNTHIGEILPKKRMGGQMYFSFLLLMSAVLLAVFAFAVDAGAWRYALLPIAAIPVFSFSKIWIAPFFVGAGEKYLPALAGGKELEQTQVLVSIATFLYGEDKDRTIFDKLEDFYLTNGAPNVSFAVLGDLPQSDRRKSEGDEATFAYAKARILALREKYGECFYLFLRERRRSASEDAYIGWERKRGGVLELCRFLRGGKTSIVSFFGDRERLSKTKYLITLDADTNLYIGAVRDLLGRILHPENRPFFDAKKGRVTKGHAVIQPRMIPSLLLVSDSPFAEMTGGVAGLDAYAKAGFDLYQELFDEGIYCGKGILDIDIFLQACDGFFPRERILSHDLAEGNLLRAALSEDVVLSDGAPKNALSYYMRSHRWLRGDLQIMPYVRRFVRNEKGARIRNPMTALSRFKIWDNFIRALEPLFSLLLLAAGGLLGGRTAFVCAFFVLLPIVWRTGEAVFFGLCRRDPAALWDALRTLCFWLCAMAYEGYLFADAAIRTLYRFFISRKNFLNWTTAFDGDRLSPDSPDGYYRRFLPSVLIGAFFCLLPTVFAKLLGISWVLFPLFMWSVSLERQASSQIGERDRERLISYMGDAWRYFRDHVNESTHFLPPDNVQLSPTYAVAMRTSPTNIGMYLLSLLAARDFELIGKEEFLLRAQMTAQTLEQLSKWNGHLYNWYDLRTLSVLGGGFVSTVDSGNFVASLIAFCEGCKEYVGESSALLHVISALSRMAEETDFSALYRKDKGLFAVGYSVSEGKFSEAFYDTFMSEARTASFLAVALRQVPHEHYFIPRRRMIGGWGRYGIASWSGTAFEYFMPVIFMPRVRRSVTDTALSYAYRMQRRAAVKGDFFGRRRRVFGISESGYFGFDGEMNYQYRAFGISALALDPTMRTGRIVAPYASFLMLADGPSEVIGNLAELERFGMYGKYGFYEALDFDHGRVGGGFAVVKSYMAHHLGMSILSAANFLRDDIFVRRFLREPHMRAARELTAEKRPSALRPLPKKREALAVGLPVEAEEAVFVSEPRPSRLLSPQTALLSNNKTKIFLSSGGHIEWINGRDAVFVSDFDRFSLGAGLRVYVNIDGIVFPTVPLGEMPEGFVGEFDFLPRSDMVEYRSRFLHEKEGGGYEIRLRISVFPETECAEISCKVSGTYKELFALLYFEPVLTEKRTYYAHKSFSDLFLESEYIEDENVLLFKRRARNDQKEAKYFAVTVSPSERYDFESMRDRCFPLLPEEKHYALLARTDREFSDSRGALILPSCAVKSESVGFGRQISFFLGTAQDTDDLLHQMQKCRTKGERKERMRKTGALLHLQYASAGLAAPAEAFERFLLGNMIFGAQRRKEPYGYAPDRNALWKHSVSGDNPIVLARVWEGTEEEIARLSVLICLFKYLCIRGVRYDFVIFFREKDPYMQAVQKKIMGLIRRAGCENFISWSCGIYLVEEGGLSENEKFAFALAASADFPLTEALADSMNGSGEPIISARAEKLLKQRRRGEIFRIPMPKINVIGETESGFFHDGGFLVRKPHGKAPFAHVLASKNFGTVLTENSLGFTFARNAGMGKLTPHTADGFYEDTGERLILRRYDPFDPTKFSDYDLCACAAWVDFGFGHALYHGWVGGIAYTVGVETVGMHDVKKITVNVENRREENELAVFYAVTPCLGTLPSPARFYRYRKEDHGVRIRLLSDSGPKNFGMAVLSPDATCVYTEASAFYTDGAAFGGREDLAVLCARKRFCEKETFAFFLCAFFSEKQYAYLRKLCLDGASAPRFPWGDRFSAVQIRSGHPCFDEIVNRWSLYQTMVSRIYARSGFYQVSGAYGFRDQLQDSLALIAVDPSEAKILILRAAAHQYEEGDVQHWWHATERAGIRTRCSDDFLWLPYVTAEYVRQTGDWDILRIPVPYLHSAPLSTQEHERYEHAEKSRLRESLFSHLIRAVEYGKKYGGHGLPLIGTCDWNDGMSLVGAQGKGESVWLAFFRILVLRKTAALCERMGEGSLAESMAREERLLCEALDAHGFDGEWYRRGYYDDGSVLGGNERGDCKIDLLPQAFAAIVADESGFATERARMSMQSVWRRLYDKKHALVRLLTPPFDRDRQSPGYIKGYVPGIRENGGQYTHAAVWAALGFFLLGENEQATEIFFAINPAERYLSPGIPEAYRIEPYVFAGDVYTNPQHVGRGGWSFYTGSAAWYRKVAIETLCGYTEEKEGFYLHPRLSEKFDSFSIAVRKRNTVYRIEVSLGEESSLLLDGERIAEAEHRFFRFDGGEHEGVLKVRKE